MSAVDKDLLLAGKAYITVANGRGDWYTFLFERDEGEYRGQPQVTYWIRMLIGPHNTADYSYIGILRPDSGTVTFTAKSPAWKDDTPALKALRWLLDCVWGRRDPARSPGASIRHLDFCCVCGAPLTTPASLERRRGPVCDRRGGGSPRRRRKVKAVEESQPSLALD